MYLTICNDNLNISNTSVHDSKCLKWFEIEGGMENRDEWYYFDYIKQPDIGTPNRIKLVTKNNDQFCFRKSQYR